MKQKDGEGNRYIYWALALGLVRHPIWTNLHPSLSYNAHTISFLILTFFHHPASSMDSFLSWGKECSSQEEESLRLLSWLVLATTWKGSRRREQVEMGVWGWHRMEHTLGGGRRRSKGYGCTGGWKLTLYFDFFKHLSSLSLICESPSLLENLDLLEIKFKILTYWLFIM